MRALRLYWSASLALALALCQSPATGHALSYSEYAVDYWAAAYGLDGDRLWAMALCESSGDPYAVGPDSPDGRPYGLLQIKPATWSALVSAENDDPDLAPHLTAFDPEHRSEDAMDGAAEAHIAAWAVFRGYSALWECPY